MLIHRHGVTLSHVCPMRRGEVKTQPLHKKPVLKPLKKNPHIGRRSCYVLLDFMSLSDTACSTDAFFAPNWWQSKRSTRGKYLHITHLNIIQTSQRQVCKCSNSSDWQRAYGSTCNTNLYSALPKRPIKSIRKTETTY